MTHTVQAIGWTLIHFCWQGAAAAVLYRGLSSLTASRSSNTRYLLALSALMAMFLASAATFVYELNSSASSWATADGSGLGSAVRLYSPVITPGTGAAQTVAPVPDANASFPMARLGHLPLLSLPALRLIDGLWLLGVFVLSVRSLGGWWLIQRVRASAQVAAPAPVRASFRRLASALGIHRTVLLRVSSAIAGPVTVGALRAMVLLPLSAATSLSCDELEVVLAHELAHVRRADFFWNLLQTLVETLFFFHPAVWWVGGRIRDERELCCDDLALTVCPNPDVYARALLQLEVERSRNLQLAMALNGNQPAQTLRLRIARILGEPVSRCADRGSFSLAAALAVVVVLIVPVPQMLAGLTPARAAAPSAVAVAAPSLQPMPEPAPTPARLAATAVVATTAAPRPHPLPPQSADSPQAAESTPATQKGDYIDRMKAAGYDVDLDKLIAMKIQDITTEYAEKMAQLGFGKLSADDLIACKVQGVTPEEITRMKQGGMEVKSIQDAISYRIFEVTPEFIASMKSAGFSGLSSQQLLSMRVQGVTPEYARSIAQQFPGATPEDLVKTRIFNIDAAFIASAKRHGFTDLSLDKLVKLRISGILDDESAK